MFTTLILFIIAFIIWKWFSDDTRLIVKGTTNRAGEDTLLAANKGLDAVEETLGINEDYKQIVLTRYGKPVKPSKR